MKTEKKFKWEGHDLMRLDSGHYGYPVATIRDYDCGHYHAEEGVVRGAHHDSCRTKCLGHFRSMKEAKAVCEKAVGWVRR